MSEQTNIEKCLDEVSHHIKIFLILEGGYDNGYFTSVSGVVKANEVLNLSWQTPKAKEELTDKGKAVRGEQLYKELQKILKHFSVDKVSIRSIDEGYGSMKTEVIYVEETIKRVWLS